MPVIGIFDHIPLNIGIGKQAFFQFHIVIILQKLLVGQFRQFRHIFPDILQVHRLRAVTEHDAAEYLPAQLQNGAVLRLHNGDKGIFTASVCGEGIDFFLNILRKDPGYIRPIVFHHIAGLLRRLADHIPHHIALLQFIPNRLGQRLYRRGFRGQRHGHDAAIVLRCGAIAKRQQRDQQQQQYKGDFLIQPLP